MQYKGLIKQEQEEKKKISHRHSQILTQSKK